MSSLTRAAIAVAALTVASVMVADAAAAEKPNTKQVTLFSGDRSFCTQFFREAHRVERISPMLKMPTRRPRGIPNGGRCVQGAARS